MQSRVRFNRICGHLTHGTPAEVCPALGLADASERFVKIKRCGCWGYHRSLFFNIRHSDLFGAGPGAGWLAGSRKCVGAFAKVWSFSSGASRATGATRTSWACPGNCDEGLGRACGWQGRVLDLRHASGIECQPAGKLADHPSRFLMPSCCAKVGGSKGRVHA